MKLKSVQKKQSETAFITGGHGFIGRHLIQRLQNKGIEVHVMPREYLDNPSLVIQTVKAIQPDYVFHLASYGNHRNQSDFDEVFTTNVVKSYFLFKALLQVHIKLCINFGSSSEYGRKENPMNESQVPEALSAYGCTKVAQSYLARMFSAMQDIPIVTVRPFSVYGEGEADFRFIPTVIRSLLYNERMTLEPTQEHDWIYIEDFLDALDVIMASSYAMYLYGNMVNIGTGIAYTNIEVVQKLEKIAKKTIMATITPKKTSVFDSKVWRANNSFIKTMGWEQKHTLDEGLLQTFLWYKKRYRQKALKKEL